MNKTLHELLAIDRASEQVLVDLLKLFCKLQNKPRMDEKEKSSASIQR